MSLLLRNVWQSVRSVRVILNLLQPVKNAVAL